MKSSIPRIGIFTCMTLVVANMVGTGIFTSLGFQLEETPSAPAIILLWVLGGLLALCGALCYAELSAALPRSGGEYHFLREIFHPALGFMAGIISLLVGFSAPVALSAMAFGSYANGVFSQVSPLMASIAVVVITTLVHLRDLRLSSVFQIVFTSIKILLVLSLSIALFMAPATDPIPQSHGWQNYVFSTPFAVSLMFTLYAYSGWNAASYILGEIRSPSRAVPIALTVGTLIVMALYVGLNAAFLHAAPIAKMSGQLNVAQIAAEIAFGSTGGRLIAAVISLGLISAISAMIWAGPRVAMVIGEDYPRYFGFLRTRTAAGIPAMAVITQSGLTLVLLLTSTFEKILVYTQFALLTCSFITVLGVVVLRVKNPALPRPFRIPLYPLPPLLFLSISLCAMVYTAISRPIEVLWGVFTLACTLGIYALVRPRNNSSNQ